MIIDTHDEGLVTIVSPAGKLDVVGAPFLEAELATVAKLNGGRAVLDCRDIDYISSVGLRALLIGAKACAREGGELIVAALQPDCRAVMEASGLLSVLTYHETVEAALAGGPRVRPPGDGTAMQIVERREGRAVVLSLDGRLDGDGGAVLLERTSAVMARGTTRLVLDCEGLTYISSAGLRAVLVGAKTCQQSGGKLFIAALSPQCRSVMDMSGFLSVIEYRETCEAALATLA